MSQASYSRATKSCARRVISRSCASGPMPSGGRILRLEVFVKLGLQSGDAHLEELVEVGCADRQEPEPLQQRVRRVARFLEHPLVEIEPAQLAIDEQARVERRGRGGGAGDALADHSVELVDMTMRSAAVSRRSPSC